MNESKIQKGETRAKSVPDNLTAEKSTTKWPLGCSFWSERQGICCLYLICFSELPEQFRLARTPWTQAKVYCVYLACGHSLAPPIDLAEQSMMTIVKDHEPLLGHRSQLSLGVVTYHDNQTGMSQYNDIVSYAVLLQQCPVCAAIW